MGLRHLSTLTAKPARAWILPAFQGPDSLKLTEIRRPRLENPDDLLVQVHAASLNPMDLAMSRGYGRTILATHRSLKQGQCPGSSEPGLPLILGRDFSGVVLQTGSGCSDAFRPGDEVMGAIFPSSRGSFSDLVVASKFLVCSKPKGVDMAAAAALPYAGLTAWSSLVVTAGLLSEAQGQRVLLLGASGGVGHLALQLLQHWKCQVTAVCGAQNREFIGSFHPERVLCYSDSDYESQMAQCPRFDIVLDCSGQKKSAEFVPYLKKGAQASNISLDSPLLSSTDSHGLFRGGLKVIAQLAQENLRAKASGSLACAQSVRWGYFAPVPGALEQMARLTETGKLKATIDQRVPFEELPRAFSCLEKGSKRGKIVIDFHSQ